MGDRLIGELTDRGWPLSDVRGLLAQGRSRFRDRGPGWERPGRMSRIIAFANQKGGVAKTTSTLTIAAALAELGQRVMAVDLDPQGALTYSMGIDPDDLDETVNDVLVRRLPIDKVIVGREVDLVPANIDLAGAEAILLVEDRP